MSQTINFYQDRVALNVLTNSLTNAKELYEAAEGHILLGLLSTNYADVNAAVADIQQYQIAVNNAVSIGLGAGNPKQCYMVADIAGAVQPQHINQVFPAVGLTRGKVNSIEPFINALVSPTGKVGYVKISTGPLSSEGIDGIVPIETAIALIKDMGGNSIKFFPMKGLSTEDEYTYVAKACAAAQFNLEPTGGIDLDNFSAILDIALAAGVPKVIPHVYTSIIDAKTGATNVKDVITLCNIMKQLVE